ncbi:hypothetical protein FZW96_12685 [Bacillus sp. BGMRC 2118]|nr:hypothetical protein FZW96_12685 [Bacillus sp. BGMRC 2118]
MKRLQVMIIVCLSIILTGCENEEKKAWEPYSPLNTTSLMKQYAIQNQYQQFKTLIQEGYNEEEIKQIYETVRKTSTNHAEINTFTLVTFDNGKMLLVHLSPSHSGEVYIQDVVEIPQELSDTFHGILN